MMEPGPLQGTTEERMAQRIIKALRECCYELEYYAEGKGPGTGFCVTGEWCNWPEGDNMTAEECATTGGLAFVPYGTTKLELLDDPGRFLLGALRAAVGG